MTLDFLTSFWQARFPGQIPETLVAPEILEGDSLRTRRATLVVIDLGHTDTDDTTARHIPSLDFVAAGDAVYNNVHLYLAESPSVQRRALFGAGVNGMTISKVAM